MRISTNECTDWEWEDVRGWVAPGPRSGLALVSAAAGGSRDTVVGDARGRDAGRAQQMMCGLETGDLGEPRMMRVVLIRGGGCSRGLYQDADGGGKAECV